MPSPSRQKVEAPQADSLFLPLLIVLFVGSGCAALIYEVVWLQLLQLVIGSSAVSIGVLLGTFMGGMCLGSLLLPRYVSPVAHPLRVYAWLELGIGAIGIAVLVFVPIIGNLYATSVAHGFPGILLRGLLCAICLLPPTVLMGATLPAIARWIGTTGTGVSWLGFFYGANIAGAVFGSLFAGFYLLRDFDMATATFVAVAINVLVGGIGLRLAARTPYHAHSVPDGSDAVTGARGAAAVYAAIAISGFCALGAEVVWTRGLSLLLGATTYTFSIILAVFLTGLGIGSGVGSFLARTIASPRTALAWCQVLAGLAAAWAAVMLGRSLPYWPVNPWLSTSPWLTFQIDLVRCFWTLLPASLMWGASFPLALAGAAARGQDPGRLVGGVYAANTVGAIAGALGFSLIVIPFFGTHGAERAIVAFAVIAAIVSILPSRSSSSPGDRAVSFSVGRDGLVAAACLALAILAWLVPGLPPGLIAYGRSLPTREAPGTKYLYVGEGINSSIAVSQLSNGVRNFHVAGKIEASSEPQDMSLQRMLGNIPALFHPKPKSVLVVGFGAGVTAGSFMPYRDVERMVICEIEPLIPQKVAPFFERENHGVLRDPRVTVLFDDARHRILTMNDRFDIITSDPIHPWVKGAATLYTKEYFELVKRHLNQGGLVTQWVPLYESTPEVVKSEIATFFEVFPNGTIWGNLNNGEGYDLVLLGQADGGPLDADGAERRLLSSDHAEVLASLSEVGFKSLGALLGTYAGHAADLGNWLHGAEINRDRNLRLQYLAGLQLNQYQAGSIYTEILGYRRLPEDHFIASAELREELRRRLGGEDSR
ncbi:MAG TPA: fused MFS/spermidine synthase [Vicinamibacterales bacterium]|jgi:spermidine synthase|nr:fused MFS/spermidine synthase [Vicinamibacterales bacterium]